jgi:catechol 2,3-dioxygenase-like lactoylglutathione lyase family enzyme
MEHVGIVVDDLAAATAFFVEPDSSCNASGWSRAVV